MKYIILLLLGATACQVINYVLARLQQYKFGVKEEETTLSQVAKDVIALTTRRSYDVCVNHAIAAWSLGTITVCLMVAYWK